jgi:hypothetical protein
MKIRRLHPEFVEYMPESLEEGVLYISERYRLCSHKCCCGCGEEVVTPLSPAGWRLTREGELVSLWPSVGNWDYACRSHYVIRGNAVIESRPMTEQQIAGVQRGDALALSRLVTLSNAEKDRCTASNTQAAVVAVDKPQGLRGRIMAVLRKIWRSLFGRSAP